MNYGRIHEWLGMNRERNGGKKGHKWRKDKVD